MINLYTTFALQYCAIDGYDIGECDNYPCHTKLIIFVTASSDSHCPNDEPHKSLWASLNKNIKIIAILSTTA